MNKVRRLALDINPWVWVRLTLWSVLVVLVDVVWLWLSPADWAILVPGLLLWIGSAFTAQKAVLWRLLPVSRIDIDRARWWQRIAGPGLLLFCGLTIPTLTLDGIGRTHPAWPFILQVFLAQWGLCALLTLGGMIVMSILLPFAIRNLGRPALLLPVFLLLIPLREIPLLPATDQTVLLHLLVAAAPLSVIALYLMAGRWPVLQATLAMPQPRRASTTSDTTKSGLRGWPVLMLSNLLPLSWIWLMLVVFPLALSWIMGGKPGLVSPIMVLIGVPASVKLIATNIRGLRALPLRGGQLLALIAAMLVLYQLTSVAAYDLGMILAGGQILSLPMAAVAPVLILLYFPFALYFGLRVSQTWFPLLFLLIAPLQIWADHPRYDAGLIFTLLGTAITGLCWAYWEITRGHRAWRIQSVTPARWRGV